jgi:multidrug efflux pump
LGTIATIENRTVPRSINRFQQFNAVKHQRRAPSPLGRGPAFLEDEAAKILPQGYLVDYTGESRQLRIEGNLSAGLHAWPW